MSTNLFGAVLINYLLIVAVTHKTPFTTGKTVVLGCRVCGKSYNGICDIYSLSHPRCRHKNTLCKQVEVEVGRRGVNMRLAKNLGA